VQLSLFNRLFIGVLVLTGCATAPPELPQDYRSIGATKSLVESDFGSSDLEKNCGDIEQEKTELAEHRQEIEQELKKQRNSEQAAGFIAALVLPPALLFMDQNADVEDQIHAIQKRLDKVAQLHHFKQCSGTS